MKHIPIDIDRLAGDTEKEWALAEMREDFRVERLREADRRKAR